MVDISIKIHVFLSLSIFILFILFIGFNITVINYLFIAFLHWNSHGDSKFFFCQYFFTFNSCFVNFHTYCLSIFCHMETKKDFSVNIFSHLLCRIFDVLSYFVLSFDVITFFLNCQTLHNDFLVYYSEQY